MHAIETAGLSRAFGRVDAVRALDLSVPAGSVFALLGPNGAGKTTTIKLLMNLLQPTSGRAALLGVDSRRLAVAEWQRIGYVSENQRLPEWMSPSQLFDYCRPFYPTWDDGLVVALRKALGLEAPAPLRTLSRGTRMKAALLASLAYRPELIVLDEPFSGLDPLVRDELVRALLETTGGRQWTVFISSHDVDEVERLADWIGFMASGRLLLAERVDALLARFRLVEVVVQTGAGQATVQPDTWLPLGSSGRMVRFIDTRHDRRDAHLRIAALYPGAAISTTPMSLRDIFVALARRATPADAA